MGKKRHRVNHIGNKGYFSVPFVLKIDFLRDHHG